MKTKSAGLKSKTRSAAKAVSEKERPDEAHRLELGTGIVNACIEGQDISGRASSKGFSPRELIEAMKSGLPVEELDQLRSQLDLPMEKLIARLGMSKATLHRRRNAGRLDRNESDRVLRYARLLGQAVAVMESLESGRRWLTSPQTGLGGATPIEYAETELGAREVENLLGRIEYGVFS